MKVTYIPTKPEEINPVVPVRIILERDKDNSRNYPITNGTTGETFAFIEERSLASSIIPALRKVTNIFER